ncbi:MAG: cellulose biosynthesis protein BcsS [Gammaproteobacteria bacterium]
MNPSLQAERRFDERWHANGIASYTTGMASCRTRGQQIRSFHTHHVIGVEVVSHGNDDNTAWQAGLVLLGFQPAPLTLPGFKAGTKNQRRKPSRLHRH